MKEQNYRDENEDSVLDAASSNLSKCQVCLTHRKSVEGMSQTRIRTDGTKKERQEKERSSRMIQKY